MYMLKVHCLFTAILQVGETQTFDHKVVSLILIWGAMLSP